MVARQWIIWSNLVWRRRQATYYSLSSLSKLFVLGGRAAVVSQQPPPQPWSRSSSSRYFCSSSSDLRSFPSLMLTPEEEEEEADAANATATATATEKTVNFPFLRLGAAVAGDHVVKLRKKVPQPLLDTFCVGSSHGWLAYRYGFSFYLANLLSPTTMSPEIIPLPSFTPPSHCTVKVALSSAPTTNNNDPPADEEEEKNKCVVFLIDVPDTDTDSTDSCEYRLAFCRIGDSSWTLLDSPLTDFSDVVYSKKNQLFYVLNWCKGDIEAWDLHSSNSPPRRIETDIAYPRPPLSEDEEEIRAADTHGYYQYLVESPSGDILRIIRYMDGSSESFRFDVYKLDFLRQKGEYLDSLGDTALFLGYNHSFALSVRNYPGLIPNAIYFAGNGMLSDLGTGRHYGHGDHGVYNLKDHCVQPIYPPHLNKNQDPLIWLAPNP